MVSTSPKMAVIVADSLQGNRRPMMRNIRLLSTMFLLAWLLVAALGARYVEGAPLAQAGATNFTVVVGNPIDTEEGEKPSWQGQNFYASKVTVNVGDTVTWKFDSGNEPHTVTFMGPVTGTMEVMIPDPDSGPPAPGAPPKLIMNPQIQLTQGTGSYDGTAFTSSGVVADDIPGPQEYKLTFPRAGTYEYICLLHAFPGPEGKLAGMKGTVTVQDSGSSYPQTPDQVQAAGQKQMDDEAARAKTVEAELQSKAVTTNALPNGSTKYHVEVGGMDMQANLEYHRFTPKTLTIKEGDTVEWSMSMPGFHTVTFGEEPELLQIEAQQAGPPKLVVNPQFFPSGGPEHTGTGYYNSGPIASADQPDDPMFVKVYSLKFTQPGRYEYICSPPYLLGMDATVIVESAPSEAAGPTGGTGGTAAGMPTTGTETGWLIPIALGGMLLAISGAAVRLRTRKSKSIRPL